MNRAHLPRLAFVFVASAFAIPASAIAEPPPPAAPVPYPNTSARDAATGLPTGKRMHKPYTLTATTGPAPAACATVTAAPDKLASDAAEGGQIARTAKPKPQVGDMTVTKRADTASTKLMADSAAPASTCALVQH